MGNNPIIIVDPDGEFIHIIIGAFIGGAINLTIKLVQGKIDNFGDGLVAFGIGAAAGAVGAATGGAAFLAAGGGAAGAGGFLAGAAAGMVGTAFAAPIQNFGNHAYFGDPLMTGKQYLSAILIGGLVGGSINGGIALANDKSFLTGVARSSDIGPYSPTKLNGPDLKAKIDGDDFRSDIKQMPDDLLDEQSFIRIDQGDGGTAFYRTTGSSGEFVAGPNGQTVQIPGNYYQAPAYNGSYGELPICVTWWPHIFWREACPLKRSSVF